MTPDSNSGGAREMTYGEKAVGITFNPSDGTEIGDHVATIKREFATAIDTINTLRSRTENGEMKRMYSVAITDLQTAQMWAVKAVTWRY